LFEVPPDDLIGKKIDDFSFHQGPTTNMLKKLKDNCGVEVIILCCQAKNIPPEIRPGLTCVVQNAVFRASELINRRFLTVNTSK